MSIKLFAVIVLAAITWGCSPGSAPRSHPDWQLYSNSRYGYQIEYPDGYDLWETGLEGERDGATLRIGRHEYQAVTPALEVQIQPQTRAEPLPPPGFLPVDLSLAVKDIVLNGQPAREAEYRWKANDRLASVEIAMQGVRFQFLAGPQTPGLHQTDWWKIIETFRFTR